LNVLIVTAHPERKSFNFSLSDIAVSSLEREGVRVKRSDLYQDGFNPVPGKNDFISFPSNQPLHLLDAQKFNANYGGMSLDILAEQKKVIWADIVMLQFPIWWGSYPGILKGWFERVLTYGFSYGREKSLPSKVGFLSVTTGSVPEKDEIGEIQNQVATMANDVFGFMRWQIIEPFLAFGPAVIDDEERALILERYDVFIKRSVAGFVK